MESTVWLIVFRFVKYTWNLKISSNSLLIIIKPIPTIHTVFERTRFCKTCMTQQKLWLKNFYPFWSGAAQFFKARVCSSMSDSMRKLVFINFYAAGLLRGEHSQNAMNFMSEFFATPNKMEFNKKNLNFELNCIIKNRFADRTITTRTLV